MKRLCLMFILCLLLPEMAFSQSGVGRLVTGKVTDETGEPLIGAGVTSKDGSKGTVTDLDGRYSISLSENDDVLVFSFLSYLTQEIKIGGRTVVDALLLPDTESLQEVVVIGYGTSKKEDLTGSVATVKMSDVVDSPVMSVDQALQGRIAGVDIMNTTGEPGAATSIRVRGTRSITASNEPLIVVDGVMDVVDDLSDINSSDIESISVLKDASSTAIYGSRGANGVIIVTTKKGTTAKTRVTAKAEAGVSWISKKLDVMNAEEFVVYRNNYKRGYKEAGKWTPAYDPKDFTNDTDWIDAITRIAPYQNYNVSASSSDKGLNWYASLAFTDTEGIVKDTGYQRVTGRFNFSKDFTSWLNVALKISTNYKRRDMSKAVFSGSGYSNGAIYLSPVIGEMDESNPFVENGALINTPVASIKYEDYYSTGWANTDVLEFTIKPFKGFALKSQNSVRLAQDHTYHFWSNKLPKRRDEEGADAYKYEKESMLLSTENTATYKTRINKRHSIEAMAGFSASALKTMNTSVKAEGLIMDDLKWNNLNGISSKENYTVNSGLSRIVRESVFGRFNYNYRGRYYVTATVRADGSSNFAANNKWAFFPSAAVKWNISKEPFMRGVTWVSDLSLRASAGRTGNDAVSAYRSLLAYSSSTDSYIFDNSMGVTYYPSRLANPDLTWEKTDQYNVALEASFLKDRIRVELDAYHSVTSDLLLTVSTIQSTGYKNIFRNLGKTTNTGVELTLDTRNIETRKFGWTSMLTVSHNRQMVDNIGHEDFVASVNSPGAQSFMMYGYKAGYPLNSLWGFEYGGVIHTVEEFNENTQTRKYAFRQAYNTKNCLGVPKYIDQDHDGQLSNKDLVYLGNADPIVYGGFQNNFTFGNFRLSVYLAYSIGGAIYNYSELYMGGGQYTNQYRYMLNCWTPENKWSDIPMAGTSDVMLPSSAYVYDASYLRLKDVTLQYTFDMSKYRKKFCRSITLGLSGNNLWLWSEYPGFDPDVSTDSGDSTLRRVDRNSYPTSRKVVFSAQIKF